MKKLFLLICLIFLLPALTMGAGPKQDVALTLQWDYSPGGIADVSSWVFYRAFPGSQNEETCRELDGAVWHTEDSVCLPFKKFLELQKEQDSASYTQEVDFSDFTGDTVYITMTARGNNSLQSDYSNIVSKDLTLPESPVINSLTLISK